MILPYDPEIPHLESFLKKIPQADVYIRVLTGVPFETRLKATAAQSIVDSMVIPVLENEADSPVLTWKTCHDTENKSSRPLWVCDVYVHISPWKNWEGSRPSLSAVEEGKVCTLILYPTNPPKLVFFLICK